MVMWNTFRVRLQRIDVEEVLPVQRHSTQDRIVKRTLHDVGVVRITFHFQHAAGEHHQADGGAAFAVSGVVR
ncbi:hypothetical protein D3C73_1452880 [compost metagenome]